MVGVILGIIPVPRSAASTQPVPLSGEGLQQPGRVDRAPFALSRGGLPGKTNGPPKRAVLSL
jgi:hypothetical protein